MATAACVGLVLIGVDKGHGLPVTIQMVNLEHGQPTEPATHVFPIRPDHEGPGRYVAGRLAPEDLVVAEDPLQQTWYAGRVDYWLRNPDHAPGAVFREADGTLRDIYVAAVWPLDRQALDEVLASAEGRTWILTSAETIEERDLTEDQRAWLESIRAVHAPVHVGRDDETTVYCVPPSRPASGELSCPPGMGGPGGTSSGATVST
ncbi:MAG: hypothetical protein HKO77_09855 [Gemmatimonadetes bacterium]|nr:hypothetical protein [Gemmatimonadota bacterium]